MKLKNIVFLIGFIAFFVLGLLAVYVSTGGDWASL
jgi:hypothetical protein